MVEAGPAKRFRFLYISGAHAERDQSKRPWLIPDYVLMRVGILISILYSFIYTATSTNENVIFQGETENQLLSYATSQPPGSLEVCVAKPGLVTGAGTPAGSAIGTALKFTKVLASVDLGELAAALLNQVVNGFEKEPLMNADLQRIGQKALEEAKRA